MPEHLKAYILVRSWRLKALKATCTTSLLRRCGRQKALKANCPSPLHQALQLNVLRAI